MSDYMPTTDGVRVRYVLQRRTTPDAAREFDRWLAEVKAAAWDEGYAEAIGDYGTDAPWGGMTSDQNPYRT